MGILNVTPDSFYKGSRVKNDLSILALAEKMVVEGATILDIGGYSSRPDAEDISIEEEISRVIPAIESVKKEFPKAIISVDTFRSQVARMAINAGGDLINDISAGSLDDKMMPTVAELKVPYIMMHMKGTPQNMKQESNYDNLLLEILWYFEQKINQAKSLGINDLILDPGFGFAKTVDQNFELLKNISYLTTLGYPLLVGVSRKSMIYKTLNTSPEFSLNGTTVLNTLALQNGASILRVHDVKEAMETIKLIEAIK